MQEYLKAEEERQKARRAAQAAGVEYIPKVCFLMYSYMMPFIVILGYRSADQNHCSLQGLKYKQKRMQDAAMRKARLPACSSVPTAKFTGIRKVSYPIFIRHFTMCSLLEMSLEMSICVCIKSCPLYSLSSAFVQQVHSKAKNLNSIKAIKQR